MIKKALKRVKDFLFAMGQRKEVCKIKRVINMISPLSRLRHVIRVLKSHIKISRELNWENVFNSTIRDSVWFTQQSISPGRMAIGYPLFYVLYRILDEVKPANVLEFGLGQSTKMLNQYCAWQKDSKVTTIEQNSEWVDIFMANVKTASNLSIITSKMQLVKFKGHETWSLQDLDKTTTGKVYDLVLVDGPFGSARYSRSQVLQLIPHNINPQNFCIILDDFERRGEKETAAEIEKALIKNGVNYKSGVYSGEKEFIMFCSPNLWFTLSY